VEFEKKCSRTSAVDGGGSTTTPPPPRSSSSSPTNVADLSSGGGANSQQTTSALQQLVRDLRISTEHEGFTFERSDLSKEDTKVLKQLCQSYSLLFDMTEVRVTVKRSLGTNSERPSPSLRAQATPSWAPATPIPLRPMDFKGISHWKEIRNQQGGAHGFVRSLGPKDGKPGFAAGRGRPI